MDSQAEGQQKSEWRKTNLGVFRDAHEVLMICVQGGRLEH